ncbi:MAG: penicillin amidase [Myxococcota bacterium]|jgi:penicillin amidase
MSTPLAGEDIRLVHNVVMMTPRLMISLLLAGCLARRTYPEPGPDVTFTLLELSAPVQVDIDAFGVPHITATSSTDAMAAIGFMHARDRGFQLELLRLASHGRLSEVLGADLLDADRRLRVLGWQVDAQLDNLPDDERARLQAYCAGVNRGYAETPRPLELKLLKHIPAPWAPIDVLLLARLQAWQNADDLGRELLRARLKAAADPVLFSWLTRPSPVLGASVSAPDPAAWPALPDVPPPPAGLPLIDAPVDARDDRRAALPTEEVDLDMLIARATVMVAAIEDGLGGSNGFAVSGDRTADGKPLLAGDPHLSLSWPALLYEIQVTTPDWEVSGATVPGLPGILFGRSAAVAWTLTVSYADSQNLTRLEVDGTRYKVGRGWEELTPWPQTFRIKDGETVTEDFLFSAAGPIINPGRDHLIGAGEVYALQWPLLRPDGIRYISAFEQLYQATDGAEVLSAIEELDFAAVSWIFATASGDIGYARGGATASPGAQPLPGEIADLSVEPAGPLTILNPPLGVVVANNQPLRPDQALSTYSSGSYRALRAVSVLSSRDDWTAQDLRGLQMDVVNLEAAEFVGGMLKVVGRPTGLEAEMVSSLSRWDYQMSADESAPLIYEAWRGSLHRRLFASHITDTALREEYLEQRLSEAPMREALLTDEGRRYWDDPRTPPVETREQAIRAGLAEAARELSDAFGGNIDRWRWDAALIWTPSHPFTSKRVLRPIFAVAPVPLSGGRHTLHSFDHLAVLNDFTIHHGPVLRHVAVPGGEAGFVLAGGSAGQPGHPFSGNQLPDWQRNRQHRAGGPASSTAGGFRLEP